MGPTKAQMLAKRKGGRPRIYYADKIAEELLEWVKSEDAINMAQFCSDRGYIPELIWRLDKESEDFSHSYTITKLKLAERRERLLNADMLNYGSFQRYQRGYDPFLARSEEDKEEKDAARRKGIVESEQSNLFLLAKIAAEGKISQKD